MYPKDYLASEDITLMSPAAEGLYNRCLMLSWDNVGLPTNAPDVLKLAGNKFAKCWKSAWPQVRRKFVERNGRLVNSRQEEERKKQEERAAKARGAAALRWGQGDAFADAKADANASPEHVPDKKEGDGPEQCLAVAVAKTPKPKTGASDDWVPAFALPWEARFEGKAPWGRIGKALATLRLAHSDPDILAAWQRYLGEEDERFISPEGFAQKFNRWLVKSKPKGLRDSYLQPSELV